MKLDAYRAKLVHRINARFFYGWVILFIAGAIIFASGAGQSHIFSVFIGPISRDLGITATAVASAYAFATLVASFGLPFMGRLVDRFGARGMGFWVALLLGFACFAFGAVGGPLTLALGFAALRFLGQGSMMMSASNMVAQWFSRRRGTAMSLMALGFSLSMAVHPPLAQWLTESFGWRQAWLWIGVSTWVLILPLMLFLARTSYGKAILAMTDNAEMARVIGIDTWKISMLVFAIGSALSAVPASLILMKDGASSHMGFIAVFMAFVAVIVVVPDPTAVMSPFSSTTTTRLSATT